MGRRWGSGRGLHGRWAVVAAIASFAAVAAGGPAAAHTEAAPFSAPSGSVSPGEVIGTLTPPNLWSGKPGRRNRRFGDRSHRPGPHLDTGQRR